MNNTMKNVYAICATPMNPWTKAFGKTHKIYIEHDRVEQHKLFNGNNGVEVAEYIASRMIAKDDALGYYDIKFVKMVAPCEHI